MSKLPKSLIVDERTDTHFFGHYKGAAIQVDLNDDEDNYYILVWDKSGVLNYDGWAGDNIQTMDEAILEAISGAML